MRWEKNYNAMNEGKFIPHTQAIPPSRVPRQGLGLFSVLAFIVAVLAGAATGATVFLDKNYQNQVTEAVGRLKKIQEKIEIESFRKVLDVQNRIQIASDMLKEHVYPSQAFNFVEDHTLDTVRVESFGYTAGVLLLRLRAPSYLDFAQQIKHYRSLRDVEKINFKPPGLTDKGQIIFDVDITLTKDFIRRRPEPRQNASAASVVPAAPVNSEEEP
ncbi:MAG: hypothetical protein UY14_C0001G0020 [Parcubacteria group bacterium GW2011_GWA1_47_9]|nr:MAG: hypothetical protein UY14_C0001G0020 [Parcubacteria group bacterium GW2011_GWA1_47_9]